MTNNLSDTAQAAGFLSNPRHQKGHAAHIQPTTRPPIQPSPAVVGLPASTPTPTPSLVTSAVFPSPASPDRQKQPLYVAVPTSPPPTRQGSINVIPSRLFPPLIVNVSSKPTVDRSPSPPSSHYLNHPRSVPGTFVPPLPRKRSTPSGTWRPPSRPRTPSTHSPAPSLPHENPAVSHRPRANHPSSPPTVQTASPPGLGRGRPRNARNATLAAGPRGAAIGPPRCALDAPPPPHGKQPGGARPVGVGLRVQSDAKAHGGMLW